LQLITKAPAHVRNERSAKEIAELKKEAEALRLLRDSLGAQNHTQMIFDKVYKKDIERLLKIDELWKTRARPKPLDPKAYKQIGALKDIQDAIAWDQKCWTIENNIRVFKSR
jgi:ubiquitin-like 1-activating enzyme E1 B